MLADSKTSTDEKKLIAKVEKFRETKKSGNYREFMLWLAETGDLETLRLILDIDKTDPKHASFLIGLFGAFAHPRGGHVSYVRLLRAAAQAGQLAIVKYFVEEKKISVSQKDIGGRDLMQVAVEAGQLEVVRYLVEDRGVEINNNSIINIAIQKGKTDITAYLLQRWFTAPDEKSNEPQLTQATKKTAAHLVNLYKKWKTGEDALRNCARDGDLETFRVLNALVDPPAKRGSALIAAAKRGYQPVVAYLLEDRQACAVKLIDLCTGKTFREVVRDNLFGNIETMQFLKSSGLVDFQVEADGQLAAFDSLAYASATESITLRDMAFEKGDAEWLAVLLAINLEKSPTELKELALRIIVLGEGKATCRDAVQSFLDEGLFENADLFFVAGVGFEDIWGLFDTAVKKNRLDVVQYLQERMPNEFRERSRSLLETAIEKQHIDLVDYLRSQIQGFLALENLITYIDKGLKKIAIYFGRHEKISRNNIEKAFRLARKYGSLNQALFHCATTGNLGDIRLLVKIRCSTQCRLGDKTLLEVAAEAGHLPVVQYLMEKRKLSIRNFSSNSFQRVKANRHKSVVGYLDRRYQQWMLKEKQLDDDLGAKIAWDGISEIFSSAQDPEEKSEHEVFPIHVHLIPGFLQQADNPSRLEKFERDKWISLAKILNFLCVGGLLDQTIFERLSECHAEIDILELCFQFLYEKNALSNFYVVHALFNAGSSNVFGTLQQFFVMPLSEYALQRFDVQNFAQYYAQNSHNWLLPKSLLQLIAEHLIADGKEIFKQSVEDTQKSSSFSQSFLGFFNQHREEENDTYEAVSGDVEEGLDLNSPPTKKYEAVSDAVEDSSVSNKSKFDDTEKVVVSDFQLQPIKFHV